MSPSLEQQKKTLNYLSQDFSQEISESKFKSKSTEEVEDIFVKKAESEGVEEPIAREFFKENFEGKVQKNIEDNEKLETEKEDLKILSESFSENPSMTFFGKEINIFLKSLEDKNELKDDSNDTLEDKIKKVEAKKKILEDLKENFQKINEASRVTKMGVSQEFAESFGEEIWGNYNNLIKSGLEKGNLDMGKILEEKKKIAEEIKEEFETVQASEKILKDRSQIENSIKHLISGNESPRDLDNDKIMRFLAKRTGKKFSREESKNFLAQEVLDFKLSIEDGYEKTIFENNKEAENLFSDILQNIPTTGFKSFEDYKSYLRKEVGNNLSDFLQEPFTKLPDHMWDSFKQNFMIPKGQEHWQNYLENGEKNIWSELNQTLSEAENKEFQSKEELIKFIQQTTGQLGQKGFLPNEVWDEKIADTLHAKVDTLWELKETDNKANMEEVLSGMKNIKLSHEDLRKAQPKTEKDFINLAKSQLKPPRLKIPDEVWDRAMKAEFEPNIKRQIKENEKAISAEMKSLSLPDEKITAECKTEKQYIEAVKAKFRKEKFHVFGWVPNDNYNRLRDQNLLPKARQGWLEKERSENAVLSKARGALNPQNLVKTVHHFAKVKGIKNPSASDFEQSSMHALSKQFGLTPMQVKLLSKDLKAYASQARQEFSRRKSSAMSEVNRYGNDISKIKFTPDELNQPVNPQNPQSSAFYRKMVAGLGDMQFSEVNDWYLVAGEAMGKIESLRQQQLKLQERDKVLDTSETPESTTQKVKDLMKNISISDEKLKKEPMKSEADFFRIGKEKLKKVHGQLSDKEWDKQMETVFYPQMKAQLKAKENVVAASMRNTPILMKPEDLASVQSEEAFAELAKKKFSEQQGSRIFGIIPDSSYDKLKTQHLSPRIKNLWKAHQKKIESGGIIIDDEKTENSDKKMPEWGNKWGLDKMENSEEMKESKGFSRMNELLTQNQYGLSSLDTSYTKPFGKLLFSLLDGMDKDKFDKVKTALQKDSLGGINDKKDKFLHFTQTLISVGFGTNTTEVKNIVAQQSGLDNQFNSFFGVSLSSFYAENISEENLEDSGEILEDNLEDTEIEDEEDLENSEENFDHSEILDFDDLDSEISQNSGQNGPSTGSQNDDTKNPEAEILPESEDLEEEIPEEKKSEEEFLKEIPEQEKILPENLEEDIPEKSSEIDIKSPNDLDDSEILMQEIPLEENENQAQNIDENITDEEEDSEEIDDELPEDSEEISDENLETEDEENLENQEIEDEEDLESSEEINDELPENSEEISDENLETEDEESIENQEPEDELPEDSEEISDENLETEDEENLENQEVFKNSEILKPKEKQEKEKNIEEEIHEEIKYDNLRTSENTENLEDENQGNQSGKKQFGGNAEEEKTPQEMAKEKLKNKELATKLIAGKSLVLLSDEDLATVFNSSQEWDLTGQSELTLLQIIKMGHKTLEVSKGGKKLNLNIKIPQNLLSRKIKNSEILFDNFISTASKIQSLKGITVQSIKDERLMGMWQTGFGDLPFRIEMR